MMARNHISLVPTIIALIANTHSTRNVFADRAPGQVRLYGDKMRESAVARKWFCEFSELLTNASDCRQKIHLVIEFGILQILDQLIYSRDPCAAKVTAYLNPHAFGAIALQIANNFHHSVSSAFAIVLPHPGRTYELLSSNEFALHGMFRHIAVTYLHPWLTTMAMLDELGAAPTDIIFQVLHGFGHGALLRSVLRINLNLTYTPCSYFKATGSVLPASLMGALTLCQQAPARNLAYACANGVFMTNMVFMGQDSPMPPCHRLDFPAPCFEYSLDFLNRFQLWGNGTFLPHLDCSKYGSAVVQKGCVYGMAAINFQSYMNIPVALCSRKAIASWQNTTCSRLRSNSSKSLLTWCRSLTVHFTQPAQNHWLACVHGSVSGQSGIQSIFANPTAMRVVCSSLTKLPIHGVFDACVRTGLYRTRFARWYTLAEYDLRILE
jgi:hypothetical protein